MKKIVIVGGVAIGASVATRLSRLDKLNSEIIVLEKDEYISFANCGLPYYVGGEIKDRERLILQTPESLNEKYDIDVRNLSEVTKIDPKSKTVVVFDKNKNQEYTETFDYLVYGAGSEPIIVPIKNIDKVPKVFTLRNVPDVDKIKSNLENVKNVLVIGGGFIGLEMAENLKNLNLNVTIVEKAKTIIPLFDEEMAKIAESIVVENGINLKTNNSVTEFENDGKTAIFENGDKDTFDMVIMSIGVKPKTKLAQEAGIKVNERGAIIVNNNLQTNFDFIYAGGDAIQINNLITGEPGYIPLAGPANRQARIIANNINGIKEEYNGTLGTGVVKIFNSVAASTGLNERQLSTMKIPYKSIHMNKTNHAGYYPNPKEIDSKIIFNPETREILGAQVIGGEGAEKRIDIIATAIIGKIKVDQLKNLELAYAPPFNGPKDTVNMMGYAAENVLLNVSKLFYVQDVEAIVKKGIVILDVRTPDEFSVGHIENSVNLPLEELWNKENISKLKSPIYLTCSVGERGYMATQILRQHGIDEVYNLSGGWKLYKKFITDTNTKKSSKGIGFNMKTEIDSTTPQEQVSNIKLEIDASGLQCPGPIMKLKKGMDSIENGEIVKITSTDFGFGPDAQAWSETSGHKFLSLQQDKNSVVAYIQKGGASSGNPMLTAEKNEQTIVVFSNSLDRVLASLIIANGALSMGKDVTLFFTFWGLSVLRKKPGKRLKKKTVEKMFGKMLPKGPKGLKLSQMNMGGMGKKMMLGIMKKKDVMTVQELLSQFLFLGGNIIACTMSMDVMGLKQEELINGIQFAGVAKYLNHATKSYSNLFI